MLQQMVSVCSLVRGPLLGRGSTRRRARSSRRTLVISPPTTAVGGIATHTRLIAEQMPEVGVFDQWWPCRERHPSRWRRFGVHVLAVGRLAVRFSLRRPTVVHLQVSERGVDRDSIHAALAGLFQIPVVAHLHSEFASEASHSGLRRLARNVSVLIVLAEPAAERLNEILRDIPASPLIEILPNPVSPLFMEDPPPASERIPGEVRLFSPALIGELKNQAGVLRALDLCATRGVEASLVMAGLWDPALPSEERQFVQNHPRGQTVGALTGTELLRAYDSADALVLFSRTEGEPMAVLEAMSRQLPVLASAVGAIPDLISSDDKNALVRPGDVEGLADAITLLASVPPEERRVQENRAKVMKERAPAQHVLALREIYSKISRL